MEFKHPKYYKELRLRNRSFLLRKEECTLGKLGNRRLEETSSDKPQATSNKREAQATSKRSRRKHKRKPEPSSGSQAS